MFTCHEYKQVDFHSSLVFSDKWGFHYPLALPNFAKISVRHLSQFTVSLKGDRKLEWSNVDNVIDTIMYRAKTVSH